MNKSIVVYYQEMGSLQTSLVIKDEQEIGSLLLRPH